MQSDRMTPGGWVAIHVAGTPLSILAGPPPDAVVTERTVVVCSPTSAALVLGSTQEAADFDPARCAAAGLDILRRRSGGGAVLLRPGAQVWIDVFVPRGDPLFDDDVLASFGWLGAIWAGAVADSLGPSAGAGAGARLEVVRGPVAATAWSRTLCFGGLGAGEVTLDDRKVVGISQRRARPGAWFHSMALLEFDPPELISLLDRSEPERDEAAAWLAGFATSVPAGRTAAEELISSVLSRLPSA